MPTSQSKGRWKVQISGSTTPKRNANRKGWYKRPTCREGRENSHSGLSLGINASSENTKLKSNPCSAGVTFKLATANEGVRPIFADPKTLASKPNIGTPVYFPRFAVPLFSPPPYLHFTSSFFFFFLSASLHRKFWKKVVPICATCSRFCWYRRRLKILMKIPF